MSAVVAVIRRWAPAVCTLAAVVVMWAFSGDAWACPTCRDGMADNPTGQSLARGFYYSILFMMSMPFLILGTLGTVAYRSVQKAKAEHGND